MGYVYLLVEQAEPGEILKDWVKIGYSKNPPAWRLNANLKHGNPRAVYIAAYYKFESNELAWRMEELAHCEFASCLHQKEWFATSWTAVDRWFVSQGFLSQVSQEPDR